MLHDLLIEKPESLDFDGYLVYYIYSYLDNRKRACEYITKEVAYKTK